MKGDEVVHSKRLLLEARRCSFNRIAQNGAKSPIGGGPMEVLGSSSGAASGGDRGRKLEGALLQKQDMEGHFFPFSCQILGNFSGTQSKLSPTCRIIYIGHHKGGPRSCWKHQPAYNVQVLVLLRCQEPVHPFRNP